MAASKVIKPVIKPVIKNDEGQSLIEFLLMFPVAIVLPLLMLKVNMAIQASIVNQQYTRSHVLWYAFNSPVYPQLSTRVDSEYNHVVMGVSENNKNDGEDGSTYTPVAQTQNIARRKLASDSKDKDPNQRALVRIRNTVTLCSQSNMINNGGSGRQPFFDFDQNKYNLGEGSNFMYCEGMDHL